MKRNTIINALIDAGVTAAYIILVASFLSHAEAIFADRVPKDTMIIPVIMLLLFVISAAVTGFAVFGKPAMWYFDGRKKEALELLGITIVFLALIAFFFLAILIY